MLQCWIAGFELLVPTTAIAQVIECDVDPPPPLAAPWLEGLGIHAGSVVIATRVCFDASSRTARAPLRLIALAPRSPLVWSVAVDAIGAFVDADCGDDPFPRPNHPAWLRRASVDGREVAWLDAAALRALGAPG